MLNSIVELNQRELSLISGGENDLTIASVINDTDMSSGNSTVIDIGNNVPAQQSSSEKVLAVAYAAGGYAWYAGEVALAIVGAAAISVATVTLTCFVIKRHSRQKK